jgi:hypothetical protein
VLASHADALGQWYNRAALMVERNNHGHAVLLWLQANSTLRRRDDWADAYSLALVRLSTVLPKGTWKMERL